MAKTLRKLNDNKCTCRQRPEMVHDQKDFLSSAKHRLTLHVIVMSVNESRTKFKRYASYLLAIEKKKTEHELLSVEWAIQQT